MAIVRKRSSRGRKGVGAERIPVKKTTEKPASPAATQCYNPATGELLGVSPLDSAEDVRRVIEKARVAQIAWSALPLRRRIDYLKKVRTHLVAHKEYIAETISRDNGKVRIDALLTEVLPSAMALTYYVKHAGRFLRPRNAGVGNILTANKRSRIVRVPYGVIGIISPWNYPFAIPFSEVVMALLSGNAVLLKTASETQMVGRRIEECFQAAGLPDGVFNYVNLPGSEAGTAFLDHGVDKLFFTGSVATGKWIMARAAETLTPLVLELGGNDAMLVCEDADIDRAVCGAVWAGLSNSGQSCGSVERIYVHERIYASFMEKLKTAVEKMRVGYDRDYSVDMGAMTTEKQVATVKAHVDDAVKKGARIVVRSAVPDTGDLRHFLPAMVLADVNHEMRIMKEETFGPVLGVMKVRDMDEAVRLANDSNLGLTGSVWSKNRKKARAIAGRIKAGSVTINDHLVSHGLPETPWGGFRESGMGRTHSHLGFDEMTQPQVIVDDILSFTKKDIWWHPYSESLYRGIVGMADALYAAKLSSRISGLFRLLKLLPRYFERDAK